MSLITQCPACTTLFKVVPDQLRVSDGWVRCGQCDEVFDANAHLQTALQEVSRSPVVEEATEPQGAIHAVEPTSVVASNEAVEPLADDHQHDEELAPLVAEAPIPQAVEPPPVPDDPIPAWLLAAKETAATEDASPPYGEVLDATFTDLKEQEQEQEQPARAMALAMLDEPRLSFMQPAEEPVVESRPRQRTAFLVTGVVLSLALLLQVIMRERDWLAAKAPATQTVLAGICNLWGCKVSALREIESVVIDSSSFVKVRTDVYRVHFTLKNTALLEIATPAVELTLTNVHDQAIARRIFLPAEFGVNQAAIAAGAELVATLPISAKLPADSERISGYRLLVFYP